MPELLLIHHHKRIKLSDNNDYDCVDSYYDYDYDNYYYDNMSDNMVDYNNTADTHNRLSQ